MQGNDRKQALSILAVMGLVGLVFATTGIAFIVNMSGAERLMGGAMAVMGLTSLTIAVTYGAGGL
jgi:uncharacterized membrane protein